MTVAFDRSEEHECLRIGSAEADMSLPTVLITHWCFSTELPYNDYFEYFGTDFKLHISPSNMTNQNTNDYLEKIK